MKSPAFDARKMISYSNRYSICIIDEYRLCAICDDFHLLKVSIENLYSGIWKTGYRFL
jgi:hypothetical protein